ncbi:MAG: signal transduction histidine kinase [Planctomycetota bacterium]|jgi:signal transduction histidine kinase
MQLLPEQPQPQVADALFRGVRTPLEALRIILEDLEAGTADHSVLPATIETLQRVRRNVESIEEYFQANVPHTMTCSVREIAYGVRNYLSSDQRVSLLIALDASDDEIRVDASMLIRSLAHLASNAIECSENPVLLRVQRNETGFSFSLVGHGQSLFNVADAAEPFASTKLGHVGLGLTLAIRDIQRLGGELQVRTGSAVSTRFVVQVPDSLSEVEAA